MSTSSLRVAVRQPIMVHLIVILGLALVSIVAVATPSHAALGSPKKNVATGACVDDSHLGLRGYECNGSDHQNWVIGRPPGASGMYWRNDATNGCIDDSDAFGLRVADCNDSDFQAWTRLGEHGWRNVATGRCLDDSQQFGLRAMPCNGTTFQAFAQP